ncbi:bromodomain containing protein 1 [Schizosaccharomyces cryophilus OY26]|uniref:Bromodomain containing protein 1 n=1 Tax=Schizosaccharomyces cryophilus (strain OY26 / ATCC MYA-4695 / CBS 11777 / NBRC 106824 / NRRL Y48691) TaxID=653667 RepID=S9W4L5_SCHCR|nr:bromodomain containing protein 1 [Schizosaccharomyces cryophilus OY26]EPY52845.1 bromodomain containing protein 1 [Schizosaccharomyces cryophilus OY26]
MNLSENVALLQCLDLKRQLGDNEEKILKQVSESPFLLEPLNTEELKRIYHQTFTDSETGGKTDDETKLDKRSQLRQDVMNDLFNELNNCVKSYDAILEQQAEEKSKIKEKEEKAVQETTTVTDSVSKNLRSKRKSSEPLPEEPTLSNAPDITAAASVPVATGATTRAASRRQTSQDEEKTNLKKFQNVILPVLDNISNHRYGAPFSHPVNRKEAQDYDSLIFHPQDLRTIKNMVREGNLTTIEEVYREVLRVFANCKMYNGGDPSSAMSIWGDECFRFSGELFEMFKQASIKR